MPTGIITEEEEEEEGKGKEEERGGSSVGGIVAGVTVPVVLLTVIAVVEVIAGVWLWRRKKQHKDEGVSPTIPLEGIPSESSAPKTDEMASVVPNVVGVSPHS
jgi:hypothetical protein